MKKATLSSIAFNYSDGSRTTWNPIGSEFYDVTISFPVGAAYANKKRIISAKTPNEQRSTEILNEEIGNYSIVVK